MERAFAFYFYVQAASLPFVWGTYLIVGPGWLYTSVYTIATVAVLTGVLTIAVLALDTRHFRARVAAVALLLSIILLQIVYLGLDSHLEGWGWVLLGEAGVLTWSALVLGGTSPYLPCRRACLILSSYWMARATLDLGFLLHWPEWDVVGVWGPTVLAVIALVALWMVPWEAARPTQLAGRLR